MKTLTFLPIVFMVVGFALAATHAWAVTAGKYRLGSRRGVALTLLALALLAAPAPIFALSFRPASYVSRLYGFAGKEGAVLWAEHTARLPWYAFDRYLYRVAVLDPASGVRKQRFPFGSGDEGPSDTGFVRLLGMADDRIWFDSNAEGLHARNPYTGEPFGGKREILKAYPEIEHSPAGDIHTPDGYVWRTRGGSNVVELVRIPPRKTAPPEAERAPLKLEGARAFIENADAGEVPLDGLNQPRIVSEFALRPHDVLIEDVAGSGGARLTRRSLDGTIRWQVTLDAMPTARASFAGGLYLGIGGEVVALDVKTGAVRWRTRL